MDQVDKALEDLYRKVKLFELDPYHEHMILQMLAISYIRGSNDTCNELRDFMEARNESEMGE